MILNGYLFIEDGVYFNPELEPKSTDYFYMEEWDNERSKWKANHIKVENGDLPVEHGCVFVKSGVGSVLKRVTDSQPCQFDTETKQIIKLI